MRLQLAVQQSISAVQSCARHLLEEAPARADYWLDELLAEVTGYDAASAGIMKVAERNGRKRLKDLLLSSEYEVHAVVEAAIKLKESGSLTNESKKNQAAQQLRTHLKRLDLKAAYVIHHLSEFFGNADLAQLGDEFDGTRSMLTGRFHTMSDGG